MRIDSPVRVPRRPQSRQEPTIYREMYLYFDLVEEAFREVESVLESALLAPSTSRTLS